MASTHAQTRFPRRATGRPTAFGSDPVLLNGHKVVFDEELTLTPVRVTKTRVRRKRNGQSRR